MAIAIDHSWDLPYSPGALFEQGVQRDFIEKMAKAVGQHNHTVQQLENGPDGGKAVARYDVDLEVPSWAAKFVPTTNKVTETREWGPAAEDGSRSYTVTIKPDNVPVTIVGVVGLEAAGSGTKNTVHFDITAQVQIFGKKLEEMVAADVDRSAKEQRDFIITWMKRN